MILDHLQNAHHYHALHRLFPRAFQYLAQTDFASLSPGRHPIDGDNLIAIFQSYDTKPAQEAKWEAHRSYADIQYIINGRERVGIAPLHEMFPLTAYDAAKDVAFFAGGAGQLI